MADDKIISIGFEAKPGSAAQQAEAAGKQTGDAFVRGANEALKKLNTDVASKFKAEGGKSFLDNLFDISKSKADAAAKTISDSVSAVMPKVGQFLPAVPKETLGDIERATLGINSFLTGVQSFATFFDKNASVLASFQLGGQAFDYAQRYRRAQAEAEAAARVARSEAAAARATSADIVGEMSGAGGFRAAASVGGGELEGAALGAGGAAAAEGRLSALAKTGAKAVGVIAAGAAAIKAATSARDAVIDTAIESAEKFQHTKLLRDVIGVSPKEFDELKASFQLVGGNASELDSAFFRLATRARRSMPEIAREVEDSSDRQIEANIKVQESGRALANAHDNVALAVDRAKRAQGELVKVQQTEQERMDQQRRAADLAVSGAQLGERGAQMRATQAAINLRAAPEQARIAEIQGPLTVRGAELGAQGARIALAEARERYYGQDPSQDEALQERKRAHALRVAINNADQAEVQERQARLNERKRREERAAGVGPEAQAQLQAAEAAQAQELAGLHTQQVELARRTLKIDQEIYGYKEKERAARAEADKAIRGIPAAINDETTARIGNSDAIKAEQRLRFKDVPTLQKAIRGEVEPGFPLSQIDPEALRKAITFEGGGTVKGIIDTLRKFRETSLFAGPPEARRPEAEQNREMLTLAQQLLGGRGLGDAAGKLTELIMRRGVIPPELQKRIDEADARRTAESEKAAQDQADEINKQRTIAEYNLSQQRKATGKAAEQIAGPMIEQKGLGEQFLEQLKTNAIKLYGGVENFLGQRVGAGPGGGGTAAFLANQALKEGTPDVSGAISELVNAIRSGASNVRSAKPATSSAGAGPGAGATAYEEAVGGSIHGLGSGTSDQIPAWLSAGEYVIKAETAGRLGEPFLDALNAGHFAEGGSVGGKDDSGLGPWAAIIKSAQWGIWAARMGLPAVGVTIPAMADVALARSNPLISAALALKAIWDETHSHPPETLGEVLREQRGGMSVNELMAKHFAETRQATFEERFPSDADKPGDQPSTSDQQPPADTFAERFSGDADGMAEGGMVSDEDRRNMIANGMNPNNAADVARWRRGIGKYTHQKYTPESYTPQSYTTQKYSPQGDVGGGGGSAIMPIRVAPIRIATGPAPSVFEQQDTSGKPHIGVPRFDELPVSRGKYEDFPGYVKNPYEPKRGTQEYVDKQISEHYEKKKQSFITKYGFDPDTGERIPRGPSKIIDNPYYDNQNYVRPSDEGPGGSKFIDNPFFKSESDKIQQMIQDSRDEERKRIEEEQNRYPEATGGLIRRYFGGGRVGMQSGGFPPAPDMGGALTREALSDLSSRLGHIPTSGAALTPSASALSGLNTLGVHQLDLRTNAGVFSAAVSEETMEAIRNSSLMSKISSAGSRPTWYS